MWNRLGWTNGKLPVSVVHYTSLCPPYPRQVYADTNFLLAVAFGGRWHSDAMQFAYDLRARGTQVAFSTLGLDEAIHELVRKCYESSGGKWTRRTYKENPGLPRRFKNDIKQFLSGLMRTPGLMLVRHSTLQREAAQAYYGLVHHGLAPRDAWHLAIAADVSDGFIVTNDADFDSISTHRQITIIRYN